MAAFLFLDGSNTTEFQPSDVFVPSLITQDNFVNPCMLAVGNSFTCGVSFSFAMVTEACIFVLCCHHHET